MLADVQRKVLRRLQSLFKPDSYKRTAQDVIDQVVTPGDLVLVDNDLNPLAEFIILAGSEEAQGIPVLQRMPFLMPPKGVLMGFLENFQGELYSVTHQPDAL